MALSYVKFMRGTPTAFAKAIPDPDTLYFISELNAGTGQLYLGSKLISGGTSISELGNIVLENLGTSDVLVYNGSSWVNTPITDVISEMTGASATEDGLSGLVPAPKAGEENKFLRGDGKWVEVPTVPLKVDSNIFTYNEDNELTLAGLETVEVDSILSIGEDGALTPIKQEDLFSNYYNKEEVNQILSNVNALQRKIVDSLESIDLTAEDAEQYIYMVLKSEGLTNDLYDEYIVLNGKLEFFGSTAVNLADYVKTETFENYVEDLQELQKVIYGDEENEVEGLQSIVENFSDNFVTILQYNNEVGDLATLRQQLDKDSTTIVDELLDLHERLAWQEIQ